MSADAVQVIVTSLIAEAQKKQLTSDELMVRMDHEGLRVADYVQGRAEVYQLIVEAAKEWK